MDSGIISFTDDEMPEEGRGHTRALHIAVKTKGMIVSRVLIDNGSALNICPFATLQRLGTDSTTLQNSSVIVRAFDGSRRETMGEIELPVEIGPVIFAIKFQVLRIPSAYNLLLGRPWIHTTACVPSSLYQKIKFVINGQLITIFSEPEFAIYQTPTIPMIETSEPSSFQSFECVSVVHGSQPFPKYSRSAEMIARYFQKNGFQCDKGLGAELQGAKDLREIPTQIHKFGLGYNPSLFEKRDAFNNKERGRSRFMSIPHISKSFISAGFVGTQSKEEEERLTLLQSEEDVITGLSLLFKDMHVATIHLPSTGQSAEDTIHTGYPGKKI